MLGQKEMMGQHVSEMHMYKREYYAALKIIMRNDLYFVVESFLVDIY